MSQFIKVCGLTIKEQIDWALELGYDAIGVVISLKSKRYCAPDAAIALANHARGKIKSFAVALTHEETRNVGEYFDIIQLYEIADIPNLAYSSSQPPDRSARYEYYFYDASVGSGTFEAIPDWVRDVPGKVVLAGGLNSSNVESVIEHFHPFGIDVSSSLEIAPGIKSKEKMEEFIKAAKAQQNCSS